MKGLAICITIMLLLANTTQAQKNVKTLKILPGAYQMETYLPLLKGKKVAVFANQTSVIEQTHLVDTLLKRGIKITKAFAPEHGFRGTADAGEKVDNTVDASTGVSIVSLYGKKRKPTAEELTDVDIIVFDIQDVGTRFYTFISSLEEIMETAIQFNKPLIVLDRPNPNGFYVDGPVLDTTFKSFIGMQPIPIVYGMTIGEYAKMLLGEKMLNWKYIKKQDEQITLDEVLGFEKERNNFSLTVIKCKNYTHKSKYSLPIAPSPNLANMSSIYIYASTCFFEGTVLSEGRGTPYPFCYIGHPKMPDTLFSFTPTSREGAKDPKLKDQLCYGFNLYKNPTAVLASIDNKINLSFLLKAYSLYPEKDSFFLAPKTGNQPKDYFFNKLAGNAQLMQQIKDGWSEAAIRKSWQPKLVAFKKVRKKYLLYPDFE